MPDNQTQPQPPEGCEILLGPWLDPDIQVWVCIVKHYHSSIETTHYNPNHGWLRSVELCEKELLRVAAERDELRERKDGAYLERNTCVAVMARMAMMLGYRAVRTKTAIEGWSEDWHGVVYIQFPRFQASWHFHDSQAHLFEFLPEEPNQWDGHTTEIKYENLKAWANGETK